MARNLNGDRLMDIDAFLSDTLSEMERRNDLERQVRIAAAIQIELETSGPFRNFMLSRRGDAMAALSVLCEADPSNVVLVTKAQSDVREYLRACAWVRAEYNKSDMSENILETERGDYDESRQDAEDWIS